MEIFNLNTLVKVVVSGKQKSSRWAYQEYRKKTFFKKELKEGFIYEDFHYRMIVDNSVHSKEELELSEYIVEGKNVFVSPKIKLYFSNSDQYQHYEVFKTNEEAKERALFITQNMTDNLFYCDFNN